MRLNFKISPMVTHASVREFIRQMVITMPAGIRDSFLDDKLQFRSGVNLNYHQPTGLVVLALSDKKASHTNPAKHEKKRKVKRHEERRVAA